MPGERLSLFKVALGADEVPAAKPAGDGLILCCERLGVQPSSRCTRARAEASAGSEAGKQASPPPPLPSLCEPIVRSVYIGDSPSDGKAARAAGMKSVGVLWGACAESALAGNFDVYACPRCPAHRHRPCLRVCGNVHVHPFPRPSVRSAGWYKTCPNSSRRCVSCLEKRALCK